MLRTGSPDLLSVQDPCVAVTKSAGLHARQVGAGAWFAEKFAPDVVSAQQWWDVGELLFFGCVSEDRRAAHAEADLEGAGWQLEGGRLTVEDPLELPGETGASVRTGPSDPRVARVGKLVLELLRPHDAFRLRTSRSSLARKGLPQESTDFDSELLLVDEVR